MLSRTTGLTVLLLCVYSAQLYSSYIRRCIDWDYRPIRHTVHRITFFIHRRTQRSLVCIQYESQTKCYRALDYMNVYDLKIAFSKNSWRRAFESRVYAHKTWSSREKRDVSNWRHPILLDERKWERRLPFGFSHSMHSINERRVKYLCLQPIRQYTYS